MTTLFLDKVKNEFIQNLDNSTKIEQNIYLTNIDIKSIDRADNISKKISLKPKKYTNIKNIKKLNKQQKSKKLFKKSRRELNQFDYYINNNHNEDYIDLAYEQAMEPDRYHHDDDNEFNSYNYRCCDDYNYTSSYDFDYYCYGCSLIISL